MESVHKRDGDPGAKHRNVELHEFATSDALLQPGRVAPRMRRVDSSFGLAQGAGALRCALALVPEPCASRSVRVPELCAGGLT